jgi:UDP-glucose 6-dehydrogenase
LVVKKISLLGLAFKGTPSTDDIRDSFSIKFYKELLLNFKKANIFAFDPLVKHEDFLKYQIKRITNIKKTFRTRVFSCFYSPNPKLNYSLA